MERVERAWGEGAVVEEAEEEGDEGLGGER